MFFRRHARTDASFVEPPRIKLVFTEITQRPGQGPPWNKKRYTLTARARSPLAGRHGEWEEREIEMLDVKLFYFMCARSLCLWLSCYKTNHHVLPILMPCVCNFIGATRWEVSAAVGHSGESWFATWCVCMLQLMETSNSPVSLFEFIFSQCNAHRWVSTKVQ